VSHDRPGALPCAFAVVRARPGRELPADLLQRLDTARPTLTFTPDERVAWSDDAGSTTVVAWQSGDADEGGRPVRRWAVDDRGIRLTAGRVRAKGRRWTAPHTWADEHAARLRLEPVEAVLDSLTGQFQLLSLDGEGRGVLAGDPLGYAFTFHAADDDIDVFASGAGLAAAALTPLGRRPERDPTSTSWFVYAPYHVGAGTGYAGVELLREGTVVPFEPGRRPVAGGRPAPWLDGAPLAGCGREQLLDRIVESVADEMQAALALDADERIVDLTGGKDSRLMLAVALLAGLADRCTFATFGPETLGDVQVARQIADRFALTHRWGLDDRAPVEDHFDRDVRAFSRATAALVNVWHTKRPRQPTGRVRVSGSFAEVLRAHTPIRSRRPVIDTLATRQVRRFRQRFLPLLHDDIADRLDAVVVAEMTDDPRGGSDALDLFETFQARNRTRKFWGPLFELESDERIWPLVEVDTVRAAFALGGAERQIERVHYEIIRRASPDLAAIPFAGSGWSPALDASPATTPATATVTSRAAPPPASAGESPRPARSEALIAHMRRTSTENRQAVLADLLQDASSPAWELVDRRATLDAFDRWDDLPGRHRLQVFGVVTAMLWLA
jgi:hypothetical protein